MENRIKICNKILKEISEHSHSFFKNKEKGNIARFYLEDTKLYYEDEYKKAKIWMKPKEECSPYQFNHGGNLWGLIQNMRDFIYDGKKRCIFSRYWGYDFESLKIIHHLAEELGFCETAYFILHDYSNNTDREHAPSQNSASQVSKADEDDNNKQAKQFLKLHNWKFEDSCGFHQCYPLVEDFSVGGSIEKFCEEFYSCAWKLYKNILETSKRY